MTKTDWCTAAWLLATAPTSLAAQGVASVVARAEVSDVALSVLDVQGLGFGDVTPGISTILDPQASVNAGKLEIRGARNAEITVDFTLPADLTVGAFSMPTSFSGTAACHHNRDQQSKCTYFDPATTLVTRIRNRSFPDNLRIIWIGGTVSPALAQFPGVYRGTISVTTAYTGN